MGSRFRRIGLAAMAAVAVSAIAAPAATADFHFMKIREVATNVGPENAYIELQMYSPGQTNLTNHDVTFYTATGALSTTFNIPGTVPNGEDQRTILIGDTGVAGRDFAYDVLWDAVSTLGAGGAACFEAVDCVSWGAYTGGTPVGGSPVGTPAAAIPNGSSLERSIAPNCSTLLQDADDTDNSAADFFLTTPSPRNNATPPTETPCTGGPDTKIDKGPKKKTKKKRATFVFSSPSAGATFECEVDGAKAFTPCTSPFTTRVKKGKHTFKVRAVLGGVPDGSPAEYKWRVKKRR